MKKLICKLFGHKLKIGKSYIENTPTTTNGNSFKQLVSKYEYCERCDYYKKLELTHEDMF